MRNKHCSFEALTFFILTSQTKLDDKNTASYENTRLLLC